MVRVIGARNSLSILFLGLLATLLLRARVIPTFPVNIAEERFFRPKEASFVVAHDQSCLHTNCKVLALQSL
jgi:hypothetical protein